MTDSHDFVITAPKPKVEKIIIESHPKIMDKLAEFLKQNDHTCARIIGNTFEWCQKDICSKRIFL